MSGPEHDLPTVEPDPTTEIEPVVNAEIELLARQKLAICAIDAIAEVWDVPVSVPNLLILAQDSEPTPVRLAAKRALRCVEAIGRPKSKVVQTIGQVGIYDYVEGVLLYGAEEQTYLNLAEKHRLSAAEVTALYELRRLVGDHTNGDLLGFPTLLKALRLVGIAPDQAATDPEEALTAFDEAGFFMDHAGSVTFNHTIFAPKLAGRILLGKDIDSPDSIEPHRWVRDNFLDMTATEEDEEN